MSPAMMCIDEAMDTLEVLGVGDQLQPRDVEAIQVVRAQVARLRDGLLAIRDSCENCTNACDLREAAGDALLAIGGPSELPRTLRGSCAHEEVESLLALIHGDGGHHTTEVGLEQSIRDAEAVWEGLVTQPS